MTEPYAFHGTAVCGPLVATEASVTTLNYRCATHVLDAAEGEITPDSGTFSLTLTTDYTRCSALSSG